MEIMDPSLLEDRIERSAHSSYFWQTRQRSTQAAQPQDADPWPHQLFPSRPLGPMSSNLFQPLRIEVLGPAAVLPGQVLGQVPGRRRRAHDTYLTSQGTLEASLRTPDQAAGQGSFGKRTNCTKTLWGPRGWPGSLEGPR